MPPAHGLTLTQALVALCVRQDGTDITLEQCLQHLSVATHRDGDEMWYCPSCRQHRRASVRRWLYRPPDVLALHLMRMSERADVPRRSDAVVYPRSDLDVTPHVLEPETASSPLLYDLVAVSVRRAASPS
jgi:ubiquitin carboxyl-terminal hydrolase 4/11/15